MTAAEAIVVEPVEGLRAEWSDREWRLLDDPGPEAVELVRLIAVSLEDGRALGLVAARPNGAGGHDEESVQGLISEPEAGQHPLREVLLSTEYDASGVAVRVGAELLAEGSDHPMRLAGDRVGAPEGEASERFGFRLDGVAGTGTYSLLDRR